MLTRRVRGPEGERDAAELAGGVEADTDREDVPRGVSGLGADPRRSALDYESSVAFEDHRQRTAQKQALNCPRERGTAGPRLTDQHLFAMKDGTLSREPERPEAAAVRLRSRALDCEEG